jgi:hypothetical protein
MQYESGSKNGVCLVVPEKFELPIYAFYLANSKCMILRQPSFDDYFFRGRRDLYYPTVDQDRQEDEWFAAAISERQRNISTIYIVSQRQKRRADEISELIGPRFKQVERTAVDGIQVIVLQRRDP